MCRSSLRNLVVRRRSARLLRRAFLFFALALPLATCPAFASVVIHEIHYHPPSPGGKTLEFVELHNTAAAPVSLRGWRFTAGIDFSFPDDATLASGGFVVVCRDRDAVIERFGLADDGVHGNYGGALANAGEELVLVDEFNAVIDAVRYDDRRPWPEAADGDGSSLERLCATAPGHLAGNWNGDDAPTPLEPGTRRQCPPPVRAAPAVVIHEIHYHPAGDNDRLEEYVEIFNPGASPVDIGGWRLEDGVRFTFPPGTRLAPGDHLAVCRNEAFIRERFATTRTAGDFEGRLGNRADRIALVDPAGGLVDVVTYADSGDWPYGPDGLGRSLVRIDLEGPGDDPASWGTSVPDVPGGFIHLEGVGTLRPDHFGIQALVLSIDGAGEAVVDNVVLEALDAPGVNILENGDFEEGLRPWKSYGLSRGSGVVDGIGVGGSRGLRLISRGPHGDSRPGLNGVSHALAILALGLDPDAEHRLSLDYRFVTGSAEFAGGVTPGGVEVSIDLADTALTPGEANNRPAIPAPFLSHRSRYPAEPTSADPLWITTRARPPRGGELAAVTLEYTFEGTRTKVAMADDGEHRDGLAGDGIWGAALPDFFHDSAVHYRFTAGTAAGVTVFSPLQFDPGAWREEETWGVYVNDEQAADSALPVYHLLLPGVDPRFPEYINEALDCEDLETAAFAHRGDIYPGVGIRFRGNTACRVLKRNLKVRFNRGRLFRGLRKVNLQGLWTDKALVREHLAWDLVRQTGAPYCETEFVRVHVNGQHHGLFLRLEHPDARFLERNGLDPDGCLYKAESGQFTIAGVPRLNPGGYVEAWEKETCENDDHSDLAGFVGDLHDDAGTAGGPTSDFFRERVSAEHLIGYQFAQVVLNNEDSFVKNHFLYRDTATERWSLLCWDLDLVFGKQFSFQAVGPGRPIGTLNDCLRSPGEDLGPWASTRVNGGSLRNFLVDFFLRAGDGFYQRAYLIRLWDILEEKYRNDRYDPLLDRLVLELDVEQREDRERWGRYPSNPGCEVPDAMAPNVELLKEQIRLHRAFLREYIETHHPEIPSHERMKITELMYNPAGAAESLEFIEILNTSGRQIDASGWSIAGGVEFTFPRGAVVEGGERILVVNDREAFCARYPGVCNSAGVFGDYGSGGDEGGGRNLSNDGEEIRLRDDGPGYPATVDYLKYEDGGVWPDIRDGHSIELTAVAPDRDNDHGEAWRESALPGGTPGASGVLFIRGDANGDRLVNLTDGVSVLHHLFGGQAQLRCMDAADADDSGRVNLTDGVYVLRYLFRGGEPPPAPFPQAGVDGTGDGLGCGG